jgi:uncharacterized RDD family membrane protein YckC
MDTSPPLSAPPVVEGAGFAIRFLARFIDTIYGVILGLAGGVLTGIILAVLQRAQVIEPGWQRHLHDRDPLTFVLSLCGVVLYHTLCEGIYGASIGKLICQLRVISENGGWCSLAPAFIRSISYFVDALFFGLIGYSSMKKSDLNQRYGDHWAHTVVVWASQVPQGAARSIAMAFGAVVAGSVCWTLLLSVGLILRVLSHG